MKIKIYPENKQLRNKSWEIDGRQFDSFIAFGQDKEKTTRHLVDSGLSPLEVPTVSREQSENFLGEYVELVASIGEANRENSFWWATDIASRNRVTSPLLELMRDLDACVRALQVQYDPGRVLIVGVKWPVAAALEAYLKEQDVPVKIISKPFDRLKTRLSSRYSIWKKLLKDSLRFLYDLRKAHKAYGRKIRCDGRPVYLIRSFVYDSAFTDKGYADPFFGDVKNHVQDSLGTDVRVLTVALGFSDRMECYARMATCPDDVVPFEAFLPPLATAWELARSIGALLFCNWYTPKDPRFLDIPVSGALSELIRFGGWHIQPIQLLHRLAGQKIAETLSVHTLLLTSEGNPWESMLIEGMRDEISDLEVIGYQHSVVPLAATGMFKTAQEVINQPLPNKLLTTGAETATILHRYSAFPKRATQAACAVRYDYLFKMKSFARADMTEGPRILVALEGLKEVVTLVDYVFTQSEKLPEVTFVLRAHPVLPIAEILEMLGRDPEVLPKNVQDSRNKHVLDDVEDCHAVLYWGTTVSVEAINLGRPVIHFDRIDPLSYDPLFNLKNFHWIVSQDIDLSPIIDMIAKMDDPQFERERQLAQDYVAGYFNEIEKRSLDKFLPSENRYN